MDTPYGLQTILYKYRTPLQGRHLARMLYNLIPVGVYEGLNCSFSNPSGNPSVHVETGVCWISDIKRYSDDASKVSTAVNIQFESGYTFNPARLTSDGKINEFVIIRFKWDNSEDNYADILVVPSDEIEKSDIVLCRLIWAFDTTHQDYYLSGVDNSVKQIASSLLLENIKNTLEYEIVIDPNINYKRIKIKNGRFIHNGKYIPVTSQYIDLPEVALEGAIRFDVIGIKASKDSNGIWRGSLVRISGKEVVLPIGYLSENIAEHFPDFSGIYPLCIQRVNYGVDKLYHQNNIDIRPNITFSSIFDGEDILKKLIPLGDELIDNVLGQASRVGDNIGLNAVELSGYALDLDKSTIGNLLAYDPVSKKIIKGFPPDNAGGGGGAVYTIVDIEEQEGDGKTIFNSIEACLSYILDTVTGLPIVSFWDFFLGYPDNPNDGDTYLAINVFQANNTQFNTLYQFHKPEGTSGSWVTITPEEDMVIFNMSDGLEYIYHNSGAVDQLKWTPNPINRGVKVGNIYLKPKKDSSHWTLNWNFDFHWFPYWSGFKIIVDSGTSLVLENVAIGYFNYSTAFIGYNYLDSFTIEGRVIVKYLRSSVRLFLDEVYLTDEVLGDWTNDLYISNSYIRSLFIEVSDSYNLNEIIFNIHRSTIETMTMSGNNTSINVFELGDNNHIGSFYSFMDFIRKQVNFYTKNLHIADLSSKDQSISLDGSAFNILFKVTFEIDKFLNLTTDATTSILTNKLVVNSIDNTSIVIECSSISLMKATKISFNVGAIFSRIKILSDYLFVNNSISQLQFQNSHLEVSNIVSDNLIDPDLNISKGIKLIHSYFRGINLVCSQMYFSDISANQIVFLQSSIVDNNSNNRVFASGFIRFYSNFIISGSNITAGTLSFNPNNPSTNFDISIRETFFKVLHYVATPYPIIAFSKSIVIGFNQDIKSLMLGSATNNKKVPSFFLEDSNYTSLEGSTNIVYTSVKGSLLPNPSGHLNISKNLSTYIGTLTQT